MTTFSQLFGIDLSLLFTNGSARKCKQRLETLACFGESLFSSHVMQLLYARFKHDLTRTDVASLSVLHCLYTCEQSVQHFMLTNLSESELERVKQHELSANDDDDNGGPRLTSVFYAMSWLADHNDIPVPKGTLQVSRSYVLADALATLVDASIDVAEQRLATLALQREFLKHENDVKSLRYSRMQQALADYTRSDLFPDAGQAAPPLPPKSLLFSPSSSSRSSPSPSSSSSPLVSNTPKPTQSPPSTIKYSSGTILSPNAHEAASTLLASMLNKKPSSSASALSFAQRNWAPLPRADAINASTDAVLLQHKFDLNELGPRNVTITNRATIYNWHGAFCHQCHAMLVVRRVSNRRSQYFVLGILFVNRLFCFCCE
jgi:hypothetical protein